MENDIFAKSHNIHFVGIGGIGISAIARMFLADGKVVSGSDRGASLVTEDLARHGARIFVGHDADHLPQDSDLVIYTIAVASDNPELTEARRRKLSLFSYPEALGIISRDKYTIAVSGTHGKTTTTAMIAKVLIDAKRDPMVIVGSMLKDIKSNFIAGSGKLLVVEACEYRRSFLNLTPRILIITNIEADHLDYYRDLDDIKNAFRELASKVPTDGLIVSDLSDPVVRDVMRDARAKMIDYSGELVAELALQVPGEHNRRNAQATLAVARGLGLARNETIRSFGEFGGTWRRFDRRGKTTSGALVYDDYAHHPTEIRATLAGAREQFPGRRIIAVFQPHLFSRTRSLLGDFAASFDDADMLIVAPIYAARENDDGTISHRQLAEVVAAKHREVYAEDNFENIVTRLNGISGKDDVIVIMGAGDISKIADILIGI